jgi:hypothetical protein
LLTLLAACGGGGGGSDDSALALARPPAQAATLAASSSDAGAAAQAALGGAQAVVRQAASLESSFLLFGNPLGASGSPSNLASRVVAASRERPAASQTINCSALFGTTACSGSVTVDTNANENATVWPAGTYVSMRFNGIAGSDGLAPLTLNGLVRIDFLTSFDPNAIDFFSTTIQLTVRDLAGSYDGVAFGPESAVVLIEFDANGNGVLTANGLRISGLDGFNLTDENNFSLVGTTLRRAHWVNLDAYVDTTFTNWMVVGGRPAAGSSLLITAGTSSVAVNVTSSSAGTVVYRVVFTVGGVSSVYIVTAAYPAGGGAPTYTVQPG